MSATPLFQSWRFSTNDRALVFNCKQDIRFKEEGIAVIKSQFGAENIVFAHQVKHDTDMIIEVLFVDSSVRHDVLAYGIPIKDKLYLPLATCKTFQTPELFVIHLEGLPPQQEQQALSWVRSYCQSLLFMVKASIVVSSDSIRYIWLHKLLDIYSGEATVIIHNPDGCLAHIVGNRLQVNPLSLDTPGYPDIKVSIFPCYTYCSKCQTVNDHGKKDCIDRTTLSS